MADLALAPLFLLLQPLGVPFPSLDNLYFAEQDPKEAVKILFVHSNHHNKDEKRRNSQSMLGAQALRTKQKVEQKEKERRLKDRQFKLELQRQQIQKAANEDNQASMLEYAASSGVTSSTSASGNIDQYLHNPPVTSSSHHHLQLAGSSGGQNEGRRNSSRKIHQRYSLNANVFHQQLNMPMSARESHSYDRIQLPNRSPSTDYGNSFPTADAGGGHHSSSSASRFLRWLGLTGNGHSKKQEKRRMSTY